MILLAHKVYLLYDDDCGICTKFAKTINRIFHKSFSLIPMHNQRIIHYSNNIMNENEYWQSFHIIENLKWYTQDDAIQKLAENIPPGKILGLITQIKLVKLLLSNILIVMQKVRKSECQLG
jgi:predicted DCC family thiol-disulfide oxidoreductase YuxK